MRLREELEEYKRREQQEKASITPQVEQTTKEIEAKIEERQRLDEKLAKEKEERALQLAIARENKSKLSAKLLAEEKRQYQPEVPNDNKADDYNDLEDKSKEEPERIIPTKPLIPQFDRSVKPQLTARSTPPQTPNIYALQRHRDFSPVSGAVVSYLLIF